MSEFNSQVLIDFFSQVPALGARPLWAALGVLALLGCVAVFVWGIQADVLSRVIQSRSNRRLREALLRGRPPADCRALPPDHISPGVGTLQHDPWQDSLSLADPSKPRTRRLFEESCARASAMQPVVSGRLTVISQPGNQKEEDDAVLRETVPVGETRYRPRPRPNSAMAHWLILRGVSFETAEDFVLFIIVYRDALRAERWFDRSLRTKLKEQRDAAAQKEQARIAAELKREAERAKALGIPCDKGVPALSPWVQRAADRVLMKLPPLDPYGGAGT